MRKNQPRVSVNLLTYNGEKYIQPCLDSVLGQTYPNIEILVIDNASTDKTGEYLEELRIKNQELRIFLNQKNSGFSIGHNQGIRESKGEFILCLNQDVVLERDFVKRAIEVFLKDKKIAALQGKLLRLDVGGSTSHIIDTTGLVVLKNRRIINRGQGEVDRGQYENLEEIFGADGAAPVYRRIALEDIKLPARPNFCQAKTWAGAQNYNQIKPARHSPEAKPMAGGDLDNFGEYFDEDFFCYKEDVDLAWRLRLFSWKAVYQSKMIAWHVRGAGDSTARSYFAIVKERLKIGNWAKELAFKNQRLMQVKNEQIWLLLKHLSWFLPKEVAAWLYVIFFERYTWRAIKELFKQMPRAWQKRKIIMERKKVGVREMERWFK